MSQNNRIQIEVDIIMYHFNWLPFIYRVCSIYVEIGGGFVTIMLGKLLIAAIIAIAMTFASVNNAVAAGGNGFFNNIFGGAKKRKKQAYYNSIQRKENKKVQSALNYYNFDAGVTDGVFGSKTRDAISSYQIFLDYPATGHLTKVQKTVLITSHGRSLAGGTQLVANTPFGVRAILKKVQQEILDGADDQPKQITDQPDTAAQMATKVANDSTTLKLPGFAVVSAPTTLANHCKKINQITRANGGYTDVSTMQDPVFALNEQFCLARNDTIISGDDIIKKIKDTSSVQIQEQCEILGPSFKDRIAALSVENRKQVIAKTEEMIRSSELSPAQLSNTAEICLGIGYRTDNMDVVLASTLMLAALGYQAYEELLGHHLLNGFGVLQRRDLSLQWYNSAIDAIEQGQPAVFVDPDQIDRTALIRTAVAGLNEPVAVKNKPTGFAIPKFGADEPAVKDVDMPEPKDVTAPELKDVALPEPKDETIPEGALVKILD